MVLCIQDVAQAQHSINCVCFDMLFHGMHSLSEFKGLGSKLFPQHEPRSKKKHIDICVHTVCKKDICALAWQLSVCICTMTLYIPGAHQKVPNCGP